MATTKVTSGGITDATVASADLANNAVVATKIATAAVTSDKIAAEAVDLTKLPHGTSSNDGKFLRANNGADPTFETVNTTPEGTAVLSTGETNGTKFLREDGDGSCSWQTVPAGGIPASGGTFTGDITVSGGTSAIAVSGGSDIRFTNGTDTGVGTKIQHAGNVLRIGGGSNGVEFFNGNTGTSNWKIDGAGRIIPSYNNFFSLGDDGNHITKIFLSQGIQLTGNTDANLLDDYEEGTWTPTINVGTYTTFLTHRYIKIGKQVHLHGGFIFHNNSSSTRVEISNIPFTSQSSQYVGNVWLRRTSTGERNWNMILGEAGTNVLGIFRDSNGNDMGGHLSYSDFQHSSTYFNYSITYIAAS